MRRAVNYANINQILFYRNTLVKIILIVLVVINSLVAILYNFMLIILFKLITCILIYILFIYTFKSIIRKLTKT